MANTMIPGKNVGFLSMTARWLRRAPKALKTLGYATGSAATIGTYMGRHIAVEALGRLAGGEVVDIAGMSPSAAVALLALIPAVITIAFPVYVFLAAVRFENEKNAKVVRRIAGRIANGHNITTAEQHQYDTAFNRSKQGIGSDPGGIDLSDMRGSKEGGMPDAAGAGAGVGGAGGAGKPAGGPDEPKTKVEKKPVKKPGGKGGAKMSVAELLVGIQDNLTSILKSQGIDGVIEFARNKVNVIPPPYQARIQRKLLILDGSPTQDAKEKFVLKFMQVVEAALKGQPLTKELRRKTEELKRLFIEGTRELNSDLLDDMMLDIPEELEVVFDALDRDVAKDFEKRWDDCNGKIDVTFYTDLEEAACDAGIEELFDNNAEAIKGHLKFD